MVKITFVSHDGAQRTVEAEVGKSLMLAGKGNGVAGIDAECGGSCACATCQVYIEGEWAQKAGTVGEDEQLMLDFAAKIGPTSRLSCQIKVTADMDGMVVRTPPSQR